MTLNDPKEVERTAQQLAQRGRVEDFAEIIKELHFTNDKQLRRNLIMLLKSLHNPNMINPIIDDALDNSWYLLDFTKILNQYSSADVVPHLIERIQTSPKLNEDGVLWILHRITPDQTTIPLLWSAANTIPRNDALTYADEDPREAIKMGYFAAIANCFTAANYEDIFSKVKTGRFTKLELTAVQVAYGRSRGPTDLTWGELEALYLSHKPLHKSRTP
jgi:hypothetical protein